MDEIKIKALIDAADSAKTIQELKKALRDLKSAAVEVGESSEYFNRITQAAGQVGDQIGDLNAQVKNLGDDLFKLRGVAQIGQGIAAGFAVAQGAVAMFSSENKALEESLLKVNGAMSMLNGIMAIGELLQKESAAVLLTQNVVRGVTVGLVGKETVAKAQLAVANGTATLTQRALNAAMTANPAGILIAAITALVGVYYLFSSSTEELKAKNDALNSSLEYSRQLLDAQEAAVVKEIDNRKKLAESRGADAKEISKLELEKLNEQEKYAKKRKVALERELKAERKQRTDYFMQGEDDLAKETNTKIEKKQEELDKIDNMLQKTVGYENQYALEREVIQNKLTQNEKKENEKRLKDNKKTTDKKLENAKKFAVDMDKVNEVIYNNEVKMQEALLSTWGDTYDKKLLEQIASEEKAQKEVSDAQKQLLDNLQEEYLKSEEFLKLKIAVTGIDDSKFQVAWNNFLKSNNAEAQKAQIALTLIQKSGDDARTAITEKYSKLREQLLEEEVKRVKKLYKESAKIVLSTDEYERFYQYIKSYNERNIAGMKEVAAQSAKTAKQSIQEKQDELVVLSNLLDKRELERAELKKKADELAKSPEMTGEIMEKIGNYNDAIQDTIDLDKTTNDEIKTKAEELKKLGEEYRKAAGSVEVLSGALGNMVDFSGQFEEELGKFMAAAVGMKNSLGEDMESITNDFGATEEAMQNFGKVITKMSDDAVFTTDIMGTKLGETLRKVMNLEREVNTSSLSQSKQANILLASLYKDKNDQIVGFEKDLNSNLTEIVGKRIELTNKTLEDNEKQTDATKKLSDAQVASLKSSLEGMKALQGKSFSVSPKDLAKQFGLKELGAILPEEVAKLSGKLTDRYTTAIELETKYYEDTLFKSFQSFQAGEMTYDEYLKKQEDMKLNHEENMLAIDVTYGNKSQAELLEFTNRRIALADQKHKEEVEKKYATIQKFVDLEKMAADLVMQVLQQRYAEEDRLSQEKYENSILLIDAEQKAYEDSIANRTIAEQQALDIQEEFELRKKQAEDERKRDQNAIAEKQFKAQQNNALAQLAIEYGVAIAKAFSTFGWPAGVIPAAWLAGQLVLQGALIKTQEFVPSFATGGLVTGPGGPKEDKVKANLSNGESVINAKSTAMFAPLLSAINQAGGGVAIPNLKGGGIIMPPEANIQSVSVVNSSAIVSLDQSSIQAIGNAVGSQQITVQENTISNAQEKQAKVERRTKF